MKFVCSLLVACGLFFGLVGCETTPVVRTQPSGVCVLKHAGEMPRQKLRYTFAKGQMEKLDCTDKLLLQQHISHYGHIFLFPSLRYVLLVKVRDTLPDGTVKIVFTLDFIQALDHDNNPVTVKIKPLLAELPQISGSFLHTQIGKVKDIQFAVETGEEEEGIEAVKFMIRHILENMRCLLPQEPVGIGATWTYHLPALKETFNTSTQVRVTLVGFKGSNALLKFSFYETVENRHFQEDGMKFELIRHIVHGQGESQVSPTSIVPAMQYKSRILQRIGVKEHGVEINITHEGQEDLKITPYADL
ncbi:MAG: hypothetical protein CMJ19_04655 [Phycisphaeraceae bacterium]|nr:hypothetical protein [Phycisphaeraceae bacterium]